MADWDEVLNIGNTEEPVEVKQLTNERKEHVLNKQFGLKTSLIIIGSVIGVVGAGIYYIVGVLGV